MLKVGLTGNIASGKSIVQSYIEKKGIPVIDADWICHRLMDDNEEVIEKVKALFPDQDIFLEDGRLGRHKIGLIVFAIAAPGDFDFLIPFGMVSIFFSVVLTAEGKKRRKNRR